MNELSEATLREDIKNLRKAWLNWLNTRIIEGDEYMKASENISNRLYEFWK